MLFLEIEKEQYTSHRQEFDVLLKLKFTFFRKKSPLTTILTFTSSSLRLIVLKTDKSYVFILLANSRILKIIQLYINSLQLNHLQK